MLHFEYHEAYTRRNIAHMVKAVYPLASWYRVREHTPCEFAL